MDDRPVAPAAVQSRSGPALDAACRAVAALAPHPAIAGPAWWDGGAPAHRVSFVPRAGIALPQPPWPVRRALEFCAALALALAPVHEAGASHGALRPAAVYLRPDGGPLVQVPSGDAEAPDDLYGLGALLLCLLTGRSASDGTVIAGEIGPAADTASLLQSLLAPDPDARPGSARQVAARLAEIASQVPDTAPPPPPERPSRRRARLAAALVLLVIAGASGAYFVTERVGPRGPALSPTTVTVPAETVVSP